MMMETKTMTKSQLYLPHELILQILLRLPVKSLLRFKSVCKSWFSLISDPHFANSHFQITTDHSTRVLFVSNSSPQAQSIDLEASLHDNSASKSHNLDFLIPETYRDIDLEIKGSCRGIILLRYDTEFHLWNPSTGFHKQIPLSPNDDDDLNFFGSKFFGFGYDKSTDDYLVISILSTDPYISHQLHLYFFSLRANAWKQIETTHVRYSNPRQYRLYDSGVGLFFNGAINWFSRRHHDHDLEDYVIVAFDLIDRKLLDMHVPIDFDPNLPCHCGLGVFGELFGLWYWHADRTIEIWVMNEYKLHSSSWTKTIVIHVDIISSEYFIPLHSARNGDIVSMDYDGTGLAKYDYEGQLLDYRSYHDPNGMNVAGFKVVVYTESLISLHNELAYDDNTKMGL